ncbi:hypothetical protein LTR37_021228, partial [Vermiconidia calcicola]
GLVAATLAARWAILRATAQPRTQHLSDVELEDHQEEATEADFAVASPEQTARQRATSAADPTILLAIAKLKP